jgi:hypothetical protein
MTEIETDVEMDRTLARQRTEAYRDRPRHGRVLVPVEVAPKHNNAPPGWAAFRAQRQVPTPVPAKRHGNWRHGDYSKARIKACGSFAR